MSRRLSASQMSRTMHCPVNLKLPGVDSHEESSERGTAVHKFMEEYAKGGGTDESRSVALDRVPHGYRDICERLDLSGIPADWSRAKAEVRFLYDPQTDRAQELAADVVDLETLPREIIPAKADLVVEVPEENGLIVIDYKSGRGKIDPAQDNWQIRTLSVAADRARPGHAWVHAILLYLDCETGESYLDPARFTPFQLDAFSGEILSLVTERIPAANPDDIEDYSLGSWCRFCSAIRSCKAQWQLTRELVAATEPGIAIDESRRRVGIENSQLAIGWRRLEAIDAMVKVAKQAFFAMASQEPIDLGNGEVLGEHAVPGRKKIDGRQAFEWLKANMGEAIAQEAVTMDVSQKAVRDTLRKHNKPQAPNLRALMASVKVTAKESYRVEVYRPGAALPSPED